MANNHYDAVVCGEDLAGIITAALLGRRGLRVLLVGHDRVPLQVTAGPYVCPATPGLLPPPESEPLERILRELNDLPVIRRRAPAQSPALQLVLGTQRINVDRDVAALRKRIEEVFPDDTAAVTAALDNLAKVNSHLDPILSSDVTLPPAGFWDKREEIGRASCRERG